MKNAEPVERGRTSDLVQIEMGASGTTVKVEGREEPEEAEINLERQIRC